MRRLGIGLGFALACLASAAARASVIVTVTPAASSVNVGGTVVVDLVAQFAAPDLVLAWGLDLTLDAPLVAPSGAPVLGPAWLAFATPDGDGLGGVALAGVTGTQWLASLTLEGLAPGLVSLGLAVTPRDRTEGFALDSTGFASNVVFQSATLEVVPEPRALALLTTCAATLVVLGRRARAS
jgi:hypothetical protein